MRLTEIEEKFIGAKKKYTVKNRKREKLLQMRGKLSRNARFISPDIKLYREEEYPMGVLQFFPTKTCPVSLGLESIDITFTKKLYDYQQDVLQRLLINNTHCGLLCASMGAGKTVMISWLLAFLKKKALILVKNITLLYQMKEEIERFTDYNDVKIWGDGKKEMGNILVMTQSAFIKEGKNFSGKFAVVIVDEADCFLGDKTLDTLIPFSTEHLFAFTATPYTNDFNEDDVSLVFGEIIRANYENLTPEIITFNYRPSFSEPYQDWHEKRTVLIDDNIERSTRQIQILKNVKNKFSHTLVLLDRIVSVEQYTNALGVSSVVGETKKQERDTIIQNFRKNGGMIIATESTLGRGFNAPEIECVCIFFPNRFDGRVRQMVGRALRKRPGKERAFILDWNDADFDRQYKERVQSYKSLWGDSVSIIEKQISLF